MFLSQTQRVIVYKSTFFILLGLDIYCIRTLTISIYLTHKQTYVLFEIYRIHDKKLFHTKLIPKPNIASVLLQPI